MFQLMIIAGLVLMMYAAWDNGRRRMRGEGDTLPFYSFGIALVAIILMLLPVAPHTGSGMGVMKPILQFMVPVLLLSFAMIDSQRRAKRAFEREQSSFLAHSPWGQLWNERGTCSVVVNSVAGNRVLAARKVRLVTGGTFRDTQRLLKRAPVPVVEGVSDAAASWLQAALADPGTGMLLVNFPKKNQSAVVASTVVRG